MESIWILFAAGAIGALVGDILKDNTIELPKYADGKLVLGFLGSLVLGGVAGYYIDGGIITAFMGGFVGKAVIENLVPKSVDDLIKKKLEFTNIKLESKKTTAPKNETIEEMIKRVAKEYGVDETLAIRVAKCESGLRPDATNTNKNKTIDRGLYQWNNYYHPDITDAMAFDPETATRKFCEAVLAGHIGWWDASKSCWNQ